MSKLELSQILGSSTTNARQLAYAQDCLLYISGSFIIFYNPIVDQQIAYLKHTSGLISCLCVSPCEKFLAVCSTLSGEKEKTMDSVTRKNNIVTLYKLGEIGVNQPEVVVVLKGHKYVIDHVAFSPDSRYLVTASNKDGSMFVWDTKTGERQAQNKNSKSISSLKFVRDKLGGNPSRKDFSTYLVTIGRGNCKIWTFSTPESTSVCRIKQQQQWILSGRTVALNKKFATKQFVDVCFWESYILLLTSDGLLCMINRGEKQQKLQKCIDLMITKTTSMDIYHNTVMCGGDNAVIKVIDLETLTLARKFPKPPPTNKQNISKDYEQDESLLEYQQSQQFPQCTGIMTIGSNKFSQFVVSLYQNLTIFIWRPEPQDMIAMRSIITHRGSIKSVKILDELKNQLTFFSTISQDNTLRIWHIYKKCIHNRESIDIAQLIGINRNAYCRNLTRIIYMQSEKQVTGISGLRNKSVACIAHREFIVYSLENFEVVCHEMLDEEAVALEVRGNLVYIGLQDGKVVVYQLGDDMDRLHKVREIEFLNRIKQMDMVLEDSTKGTEPLLAVLTADTEQTIIYSLKKSKIVHIEKNSRSMCPSGHNILIAKADSIHLYNPQKQKSSSLLSLKHELAQPSEYITNISSNAMWIAVTTSANKLIIANFSPAIVAIEQFGENINDMAVGDSGEIILVGDYGDVLVYRMVGNSGYEGMEEEVRKWMRDNDMSWMDGSVWAQRKSKVAGDRQLSGSVVDSIRLKSSANNTNTNRDSMKLELPNMEIKYKSMANGNDQSVFNPSDILKQAKQIYANIDGIQKKFVSNSNVIETKNKGEEKPIKPTPKLLEFDEDLQEVKIAKNDKSKPPVNDSQGGKNNAKKRIFGLSITSQNKSKEPRKSEEEGEEGLPPQFRNNLVSSIIHSPEEEVNKDGPAQGSGKKNAIVPNFSQFLEDKKVDQGKGKLEVREASQISRVYELTQVEKQKQKETIIKIQQRLSDRQYVTQHRKELETLQETLAAKLGSQQITLSRDQVLSQFNKLSTAFVKFLAGPQ